MSLGIERELISIEPEIIFKLFGFNIANSTLLILLIFSLILFFSIFTVKKFKLNPTSVQVISELVYEKLMDFIKELTNRHPHSEKIFPIIASILIYFVISNIITIIPGLSNITYNEMSIFRTPTSDINTVIGVAFAAVVVINLVAIKEEGFFSFMGNFFKFKEVFLGFKKSFGDGLLAMIDFFVGLLDIIGEFAKIASLSFRLFGNVFAGEILAMIILGSFVYVLPAIWSMYSGFVGILQGVVFASLVAVYYGLSVKPREKKIKK